MLNPTSPGLGGYVVREFLGAQALDTGTWLKSSLASEEFLVGKNLAALEYEIEAVGGGGCGDSTNGAGMPGGVNRRSLTYAELPETADVVRGAGSSTSASPGGYSAFGEIVFALGGDADSRATITADEYVRPGPGYGGSGYSVMTFPGKANGDGTPGNGIVVGFQTAGGNLGGAADVTGDLGGRNGENSEDARKYGGGAARYGRGGFPGGGGGHTNGRGGNGVVRIRVWEHKIAGS